MSGNRLIIALREEEDLKAYSGYLRETGFEIIPVSDGTSVIEHALEKPPSLIITELDLPLISGEKLFKILRSNPHTANVPFLFVADAVADIKGFRPGSDIFLARPVNLDELHGRIRQTLSLGGMATGTKEIEGRLSHMPLPDIIQFLHMNRKEGELRVTSHQRTGSVYLKDGDIYNAYTGGVEKEKALFRLLLWTEGKFEFIPMPVTVGRKLQLTVSNLLMEGMRQADEFKKMQAQFPDKKSILKKAEDAPALPAGLAPVIYDVVDLARTYARVEEIVEHCAYPDFPVYRAITALIRKKVLVEEGRGHSGGEESDGILPPGKMINLREKIISRFSDIFNQNYGKILLVSTSGAPVASFIKRCATLPGFSSSRRPGPGKVSTDCPLGASGSIGIYGGMDIILFSIPDARHLGPLWRAFGANVVGLVLLWDEEGAKETEYLGAAKRDILLHTRVPVAHVYCGSSVPDEAEARKSLGMRHAEAIYTLSPEGEGPGEVFTSLFNDILRDDYITS